jgi:hypothetical protein
MMILDGCGMGLFGNMGEAGSFYDTQTEIISGRVCWWMGRDIPMWTCSSRGVGHGLSFIVLSKRFVLDVAGTSSVDLPLLLLR